MKKTIKTLSVLTTVFGSLMVVFACLFLSFFVSSNTYKTQLENSYMRSFYEMVDNVNTLEVDLSKIVATTSLSSQRQLLSDIYNTCVTGVNNINILPISNEKLSGINKLMNTMGGFSYSLLLENYKGALISSNDYQQIETLYDSVRELQYDINSYMKELQYDYSILDDVNFDDVSSSSFSGGIVDVESSSSEVPTLIYDGPFSDSVLNKEVKGLPNNEYSQEEVLEQVQQLFPEYSVEYIGESFGKFETYNYEVSKDLKLFVSVTKKGGFLLTITAYGNGDGVTETDTDGVTIAENFAYTLGIDNMYAVWQQQTGNIVYVNLAPIVDHVIYYCDLIKVKVDLSLGRVVGWEASAYATNHIDREFSNSIGILDAEKQINDILSIEERNLCIVPDKYVGELSAYEFICTWENYTYYIYIDSNTGEEINIQRVIETSNGQLLM